VAQHFRVAVPTTARQPKFLNVLWRLKSHPFEEICLFKGQIVHQGSQLPQFFCVDYKDCFVRTVKKNLKLERMTLHLHFTVYWKHPQNYLQALPILALISFKMFKNSCSKLVNLTFGTFQFWTSAGKSTSTHRACQRWELRGNECTTALVCTKYLQ
jgi:hypothetical protein